MPVDSNLSMTEAVLPEKAGGAEKISECALQPGGQSAALSLPDVVPDAAGDDEAPAEAVAADKGGHVEEIAPDPAAIGHGRQKADVAGQRAQVAGMIGAALQLEGEGPDEVGVRARPLAPPAIR